MIIEELLLKSSNFKNLLIKNVQIPQNQLHQVAKELKDNIVKVITQLPLTPSQDASDDLPLQLLITLFGPNTFTHLSTKKNQDILFPITSRITAE